jgi:HlyD family secretion protein
MGIVQSEAEIPTPVQGEVMKPKRILAALLVISLLVIAGVVIVRHRERNRQPVRELTLYGNVDLRQVALAFNNSERIAAVLVEEGDRVKRGQVLARLDRSRIEPLVARAEAQVAAQQATVDRLHHGTRPEEIAQARAALAAAAAEAGEAQRRYDRLAALRDTSGLSPQDLDSAKAAADSAAARKNVSEKALDLAVAGPRREDVAEAEAGLRAAEAQLALLRRQLDDTVLQAPVDGVVRTRILEPGEMASPQKPVFTLAVVDPKWVRAYLGEADLGNVHPGMSAAVTTDSFPDRRIEGQVGYISSVAEFTPKTLETAELRTSLVYEIRVRVKDPDDELRLGMPVTVHLSFDGSARPPGSAKD